MVVNYLHDLAQRYDSYQRARYALAEQRLLEHYHLVPPPPTSTSRLDTSSKKDDAIGAKAIAIIDEQDTGSLSSSSSSSSTTLAEGNQQQDGVLLPNRKELLNRYTCSNKNHNNEKAFYLRTHHVSFPPERYPAVHGCSSARVWQLSLPGGGSLSSSPLAGQDGDDTNVQHVVLIHGGGGTPGDWAPLLAQLQRQQHQNAYCLWIVERPGHACAPPFAYGKCPARIDEFAAAFLHAVLQELRLIDDETEVGKCVANQKCTTKHHQPSQAAPKQARRTKRKVHIIGNSLGGAYAVWFALRHGHCLVSLALVGAPAGFTGMRYPLTFYLLAMPWIGKFILATPLPTFMCWLIAVFGFGLRPWRISAHWIEAWRCSMAIPTNIWSFQELIHELVYGHQRAACEWRWQQLVGRVQNCPLLFVDGYNDLVLSRTERASIQRALAATDSYRQVGVGHLPWLEHPEDVAATLIKFWKSKTEITTTPTAITTTAVIDAQ